VFVPATMLGITLVAVFQHRLSGLAHDASHYTLFRNRLVNELASDLLLLFPLLAMTQKYRAAHLGHHRFVNDPERDPDLVRLNYPEPQRFPICKPEFWFRYVIRSLWPPEVLRYLIGRAKAANLGTGGSEKLRTVYRSRVARSLRGAYWLTVLTIVHASHAWPVFWLFWILPLLTVYPFLMQLREIAHHMNAPDDGELTNSRVFQVNPWLGAAVFPYGQAFHLTHHLFAMIPHYRIAQAHDVLRRYRPYREQVVVCRGYFFRRLGTTGPSVLDLLSRPAGLPAHTWRGPSRRAESGVASDPSFTTPET
jgi:fatty acid desaturase